MNHDDGAGGNRLISPDRPSPHPGTQPTLKRRTPRRRAVTILFALEFIVAVMVRIFLGVIVLVLPWSPLWDNNHLLQTWPHLGHFMSFGATRGVLSGIGLLNLWAAVDDTLHRGERHF